MYEITVPPPIDMVDMMDEPLPGKDNEPWVLDFLEFILGRVGDPAFAEGKKGLDLVTHVLSCKEHIRGQAEMNGEEKRFLPVGQSLRLENEEYKGVKRSCDRAELPPVVAANLKPFFAAVAGAKEVKPGKPKPAAPEES